jgi:hypothetical protein
MSFFNKSLIAAAAIACSFAASAEDKSEQPLPKDAGVYVKGQGGQWEEIEPEIINWKTGGVMKSTFTYGVVKGDINGHVKGGKSKTKIGSNEILVVALDGVSIAEYELLRMHEHSNSREFRAATGGVFHQSGGSDRDEVDFEHKKLASRTYLVTLPHSLKDGEYGLLPPGAVLSKNATSLGKIYSFTLAN